MSNTKQRVGVVGAGTIGVGVAQNFAQVGVDVVLVDVRDEALAAVESAVRESLRFQQMFRRGQTIPSPDDVLAKLHRTRDDEALSDVAFVVENATEKWEIKAAIYPRLDAICSAECVIAANTSAISITRLASLTERADRILGIHFMNPVPMKNMVEVIRGHHTSDETLEEAARWLDLLGKRSVVVQDWPGFVTNRVLMLTINEAIFVVQDQVAEAKQVDEIFKGCFGHKMGPLETADLIGLDTILYTLEVLSESYDDSKYRPSPLLKKMVDAGLLGRKSGEGFYSYRRGMK